MKFGLVNIVAKWVRSIFYADAQDAIFANIKGIPSKSVEVLTAEEVVGYFKSDVILNKLQSNDGYIAVAIRRKTENGYDAVLCIYDKNNNIVVDSNAQVISAKQFDYDLQAMFGDKDMLVLT